MIAPNLQVRAMNPRAASEQEYIAIHRFSNILRAERLPEDPPMSLEETIQGMRNIPSFVDVSAWGVIDSGTAELIASAWVSVFRLEQNKHVAEFEIEVLPAYRRQGIARHLLALAAEVAQRENRRLMMTGTNSNIPAGEAFVKRLGATLGLSMHTNQLNLDELDRSLIQRWIEKGQAIAGEFELGLWIGDYPEAEMPAIAELFNVMNSQPRENLDVEDWQTTPDMLRQIERSWSARGGEHWTIYARHKPSGELAGFTDVVWYPTRPELLNQGNTGVWHRYRDRGLGRWMKAAMLEKVLRERPQVKKVRTGNAFSNAPMLKINQELGFKPYQAHHHWQVETEKVMAYLQNREEAVAVMI